MAQQKNKRIQSFIQLALLAGSLVFINVLGNYFYTNFDLTEEKRYTLTDASQELLNGLDDVVYIQVLLDGEFPAGFKRLQRSVREMLEDFRSESGYIEYEFVNPNEGTVDMINARREQLSKEGIVPVNLRVKSTEGTEEKQIYPWVIITYKGRQQAVSILESQTPGFGNDEVVLNNSIALLEYKFANAIQKLKINIKKRILFTKGHGELEPIQVRDFERALREDYDTGHLPLDSVGLIDVEDVAAVIVAKPRIPFSENDKFKLDQYVMSGGKILWLVDRLNVNVDSIGTRGRYVPSEYNLNLADLWFKYGFRLNPDLVLDLQNSPIPMVVGYQGDRPQLDLFPYFYHPVVTPQNNHPIVKGVGPVNLFFPSMVDTSVLVKIPATDTSAVMNNPVEKTVLLASSEYSRLQFNPVTLDFEILRVDPVEEEFDEPNLPMAVLLEGIFPSFFANRMTADKLAVMERQGIPFRSRSVPTGMLVVSDGDVIKNLVGENETFSVLGRNRYNQITYANKDFLLNAVEYLLDESGVIAARGKNVELRLLDTVRAKAERTKWQLINIVFPLVFLALFGLAFNYIRRRRYAL